MCRGIRRLQGDNQCTRFSIMVNVMRTLKEQLHQSPYAVHEQWMLWCAFTLAFYGFLRVSYTNLRWCDVNFATNHLSTILHQSKTDPFRRGCTVKIFKTKSSTCPCHTFEVYRKISGIVAPTTLLFKAGRFHPLSRAAVTETLHKLLHQAGLNESQ